MKKKMIFPILGLSQESACDRRYLIVLIFEKMSPEQSALQSLFDAKPIIRTPALKSSLTKINKWIDNGVVGGAIYGKSRIGKTEALRYLGEAINRRYNGGIPFFEVPGMFFNMSDHNQKMFWRHLLTSVNHQFPYVKGDDRLSMQARLAEYLVQLCDVSAIKKPILWIDEAQEFAPHQWDWMLYLSNLISKAGGDFLVLCVGYQLDLTRKKLFDLHKQPHIGRFMAQEHPLFGIRTEAELRSCLKEYDAFVVPGVDPTKPVIKHIVPKIANSWNLEEISTWMYEAYKEEWIAANPEDDIEITMQHFNTGVRNVLNKASKKGARPLNAAEVKLAIRETDYRNFLTHRDNVDMG